MRLPYVSRDNSNQLSCTSTSIVSVIFIKLKWFIISIILEYDECPAWSQSMTQISTTNFLLYFVIKCNPTIYTTLDTMIIWETHFPKLAVIVYCSIGPVTTNWLEYCLLSGNKIRKTRTKRVSLMSFPSNQSCQNSTWMQNCGQLSAICETIKANY